MRKKSFTGQESLVGARAFVYSEVLNAEGEVRVDGVVWRARLVDTGIGPLKRGDEVMVSKVEGLTLLVNGKRPITPNQRTSFL
jgi:membrane protein implicated in regulation of membrane protease activity